jgi:hypothetical protein
VTVPAAVIAAAGTTAPVATGLSSAE